MQKHDDRAHGDPVAWENRTNFYRTSTLVFNVIGAPGAGKTAMLDRTLAELRDKISLGVLTSGRHDADKLGGHGVQVTAMNTGSACHVDAAMVRDGLSAMKLDSMEVLFIENIGGIVCPIGVDLGESMKVVVVSVAEEDDEPLKYPALFKDASILIINKMDLLPWVNYELDAMKRHALAQNPSLKIFQMSATMGIGIREWTTWLLHEVRRREEVILM